MRERLEAWLRGGGRIRIVPIGSFLVAVLLGVIPMWLEFGTFPDWAPRQRVAAPLLAAWIIVFLAAEVVRRQLAKRGVTKWESQWKTFERDRADQLAGVIDRLCAPLLPQPAAQLAPDHIQAALLQGIVDVARALAEADGEVRLHASLLVPETRRQGKRTVRYLKIVSTNRLADRRGWASFRLDGQGPAQDSYRYGRVRVVPDTRAQGVRNQFPGNSYRSIVTLPVALRCAEGKPLAVVSIDASIPGLFTQELVRDWLEQAASPNLKLIALSLVMAGRNS